MQLTINKIIHNNIKSVNIEGLVDEISLDTAGTAIAVNQKVISRENWQSFDLKENDEVFIIRATHGG